MHGVLCGQYLILRTVSKGWVNNGGVEIVWAATRTAKAQEGESSGIPPLAKNAKDGAPIVVAGAKAGPPAQTLDFAPTNCARYNQSRSPEVIACRGRAPDERIKT